MCRDNWFTVIYIIIINSFIMKLGRRMPTHVKVSLIFSMPRPKRNLSNKIFYVQFYFEKYTAKMRTKPKYEVK